MFEILHPPSTFTDGSIALLGLPVLFVIFTLKGAFIGKVFPTSVFLPGYVIASGATSLQIGIITVVVSIGYMVGQFAIFVGSRRYGPLFVTRVPYTTLEPESTQFERFDSWFDKYGGPSIFVTNFIPWVRGLLTIPAGASSYSMTRYTVHMGTSTLLYHVLYVGIALVGFHFVS